MNNHKVEISFKTILLTTLFLLGLYFLWVIKDLIFSLFIAFIIMSALRPPVNALVKKKVPRLLAAILVFVVFIFFFAFLISLIIPPIVSETTNLIISLPAILRNVNPALYSYLNLGSMTQYVPNVTSQIFKIATGLFSNLVFVISTLFFSFYFLLEENIIRRFLMKFVAEEKAHRMSETIKMAERRMSSWFWGELQLMTVVGCLSFIGFNLIGLKYALPLAVLAGLLEVVPNIGPILAAVPAVLIGFSQSYIQGFAAVILAIVVQQLENNLIVPIVMRNAVGLNPIVTLVALIIGSRVVGGVLGVLLAIPAFLFIETIVTDYFKGKKLFDHLKI